MKRKIDDLNEKETCVPGSGFAVGLYGGSENSLTKLPDGIGDSIVDTNILGLCTIFDEERASHPFLI
jgi:hypothetical protein